MEEIQESFSKQGLMKTLGATLQSVENGKVTITVPFHEGLTQQHGFFHAGVLTSIVDSACGYAALTTALNGKEVLTVEFKINFLKPAKASKIIAVGQVVQSGRSLIICEGNVYNETGEKTLAKMMATIIAVDPKGRISNFLRKDLLKINDFIYYFLSRQCTAFHLYS